jgi:ribosomal protein L37AE/L43A
MSAAGPRPAGDGGAGGAAGTERQVPFYCPYCGEEDLRPSAAAAGSWQCAACARAFQLRFAGVVAAGELPS